MFSICLRYVKNQTDAEDVFQQAFMMIYKNIGQLKNIDALSGWVKSIVVNAAIEQNRKKYQLRIVDPSESEGTFYNHSTINDALDQIATNELSELIQKLPAGCREVFNMYVIDGYSHKEIAEELNISVGTSKSQLFDARKILKNKIAKQQIPAKRTGN